MDGTNPQRMARVAANLTRRPWLIPRYFRSSLRRRHSPLQLGLPWISWGAIDALKGILTPTSEAFEYGTGGSTVFLAAHCRHVTSVEESEEWFDLTKAELDRRGLTNVQPIFAEADFTSQEHFVQSPYFLALPEEPAFDLILIDGQDNDGTFRPLCFQRAERAIRPDGVIVVDDAWRYPSLAAQSRATSHRVYRSVGPARLGVTQTDIYHY